VEASEPPPARTPALPIRTSVLLVLALATAIYCVAQSFGGFLWVTVPLGLLTLLFTPGYGLLAIGVGERKRWPWYLTFILAVGLSVAFNVAVGLLLLEGHYGLIPLVLAVTAILVVFLGAVVQHTRARAPTDGTFVAAVGAELRLRDFSPAQRVMAYALVVAIIVVLGGLTYIASVNPKETKDVSFGVTGPDGTATSIPTRLNISTDVTLLVTVGNNATAQAWYLYVSANATLSGNSSQDATVPPPAVPRAIPWVSPLPLLNGNYSETSLGTLAPNQVLTYSFSFNFTNVTLQANYTGPLRSSYFTNYTLSLELRAASGGPAVRSASWAFSVHYLGPGLQLVPRR
jgi:uncharacterized membrane protein